MEFDDDCRAGLPCEDGRWACAQQADWRSVSGLPPWEADDEGAALRFLATASADEWAQLAENAADRLRTGAWEGVPTPEGGWRESFGLGERELAWHACAQAFLERYDAGDRHLDEGMLTFARWDLGQELAWLRGWCLHRL